MLIFAIPVSRQLEITIAFVSLLNLTFLLQHIHDYFGPLFVLPSREVTHFAPFKPFCPKRAKWIMMGSYIFFALGL